jgi:hypothetical protein
MVGFSADTTNVMFGEIVYVSALLTLDRRAALYSKYQVASISNFQ